LSPFEVARDPPEVTMYRMRIPELKMNSAILLGPMYFTMQCYTKTKHIQLQIG